MKKVLVNIPERKYVPTLGMGPHRMVYLRSDLVRPLRAYGLIIQVLKEERRKLHVDVPTERKVETETVANQPTTTVSAQPTTTAPPVQPTFETPKTDVPVNNTPEFTGGVNGTEAAVSETGEVPTPTVEEKHEEAPVAAQPEVTPTVTEPAHTEEQPQPTATGTTVETPKAETTPEVAHTEENPSPVSQPVTEEHHEEAPVAAQPEVTPTVTEPAHTEEQPQPSATETPSPAVEEHHEEVAPVVSQPETVVEAPKTETTSEVAHVEEAAAPVSQPVAEEHHEEAPVAEPTHATEEVPSPVVETTHVEETHADEQPQPAVEEKHEEAPVASQPEVAPAATEGTPTVEETNEVPDTEVTTEPVAAAGTYSTTTGRTIEISEEEYALLSREGVTKQELKDLLNAKGFRTLYRDTLKDLFAKFGIEY